MLIKTGSQQQVLKKSIVWYYMGEFIWKVGVEREEFLRKSKIEHTHSWSVSML
jgi:hypothetical protein